MNNVEDAVPGRHVAGPRHQVRHFERGWGERSDLTARVTSLRLVDCSATWLQCQVGQRGGAVRYRSDQGT